MAGTGFFAAAAGAYQAWLEAKTARRNTDATNRANQQMAEYAYNRDQAMWQMGNEYNAPEAQMARLKSAGLNPNMVYGSGNAAGNASAQLPKYQAPRMEFNYKTPIDLPGMISMYQDVAMKAAQIDQVRANTDYVRGGVPLRESQRLLTDTKQNTEATRGGSELLKQQQDVKLYPYQLEMQKERTRSSDLENERREAELLFMKYRNEWMRMGITSSDHIALRAMVRMLSEGGLSYDSLKSE